MAHPGPWPEHTANRAPRRPCHPVSGNAEDQRLPGKAAERRPGLLLKLAARVTAGHRGSPRVRGRELRLREVGSMPKVAQQVGGLASPGKHGGTGGRARGGTDGTPRPCRGGGRPPVSRARGRLKHGTERPPPATRQDGSPRPGLGGILQAGLPLAAERSEP